MPLTTCCPHIVLPLTHPPGGIPPGSMLFRSGYKKDFSRIEVNNNDVRAAALAEDRE